MNRRRSFILLSKAYRTTERVSLHMACCEAVKSHARNPYIKRFLIYLAAAVGIKVFTSR